MNRINTEHTGYHPTKVQRVLVPRTVNKDQSGGEPGFSPGGSVEEQNTGGRSMCGTRSAVEADPVPLEPLVDIRGPPVGFPLQSRV